MSLILSRKQGRMHPKIKPTTDPCLALYVIFFFNWEDISRFIVNLEW